MTREELIATLKTLLWENDETKIVLLINSAIAYINWYTFQDYSLSAIESIPSDVFMVILELVKNKYYGKAEWDLLLEVCQDLYPDHKLMLELHSYVYFVYISY